MKVVIAPDSFKGTLSAVEAAAAMARGVSAAGAGLAVDLCPIADGGEGFTATLLSAAGGESHDATVTGPLGRPVRAVWGRTGDGKAVIETAAAAGLMLVPEDRRDPTRTTSFGLGELMGRAIDAGCRELRVGLGGSGTNDGGTGMAQALGVRFFDRAGRLIEGPLTGGRLGEIGGIDAGAARQRLGSARVVAACDVDNLLTGAGGASAVYGPQKGATAAQVRRLDAGLVHLAEVCRRELGMEVGSIAGGGAAGGLGAGLVAFAGAELRPGIELVLEAVGFEPRLAGAGLCVTGEGRLDGQTGSGKAVGGVAAAAKRAGVPTVAVVGSAEAEGRRWAEEHLRGYVVMADEVGRERAVREAGASVAWCTRRVVEAWLGSGPAG